MDFAKIFDTKHGQVAAIQQSNDEGAPEIRIFFNLSPVGQGVSNLAFSYEDSDEGWDKCDAAFQNEINAGRCERIVAAVIKQAMGLAG